MSNVEKKLIKKMLTGALVCSICAVLVDIVGRLSK